MQRILIIAFAAVAVIALATGGRLLMTAGQDVGSPSTKSRVNIGGPFTLTDHTGKRVTEKDFEGKYMLIYFGYTFCPDVCPTSLSIISDALDQLSGEELDKLTPVFVSVDHERDTPEVLASYVPHFHEKLVGLTGSAEEIKSAAKVFKAFYAKVNEDDPDGNYLMDHSSTTYLMGPDGAFVMHFNHGTPPADMAKRLAEVL